MKIVYLSILFLTLQTVIYSQHSKDSSKVYEFLFVDKIPKFSLKDGSFQEYLQSHITSPKYFDGESKVVVSFIINENGAVSNIVVLNSTTEICSNIVTNVLKNNANADKKFKLFLIISKLNYYFLDSI